MTTKRESYKSANAANAAARKKRAEELKKPAKKAAKKFSRRNMYLTMLSLFEEAGVRFRTWKLKTTPGLQEFDGHYIIVGSSGSEPYTGFSFDTNGLLREVTSVSTSDDQQVAVESVGRRTMTCITPFNEGTESTYITNPEEN